MYVIYLYLFIFQGCTIVASEGPAVNQPKPHSCEISFFKFHFILFYFYCTCSFLLLLLILLFFDDKLISKGKYNILQESCVRASI